MSDTSIDILLAMKIKIESRTEEIFSLNCELTIQK